MNNLMCEQVTIYTEVTMTDWASISTTVGVCLTPFFLGRNGRKWFEAGETSSASSGLGPWHFNPVHEWKQVMVGPGEMSGQNESQPTDRAFRRQIADFGVAARTEVAIATGFGVAGTETRMVFDGT